MRATTVKGNKHNNNVHCKKKMYINGKLSLLNVCEALPIVTPNKT